MRIILDTGVFFRKQALLNAEARHEPLIVPAIVFAERLRQVAARGISAQRLAREIERFGGHIEPFGPTQAARFVPGLADLPRRQWQRLARDAMIAGHLRDGDELWTTNVGDFEEIGVEKGRIVGV
ncbi:MAG: type II toxin-antitoxin system VapC family toxin [Thermoplasmatota archaeon]